MKNKLILIGLCFLLSIMPTISSTSYNPDSPLWAVGTFSGKWGLREYDLLTDIFDGVNGNGMIEYEIGEIFGHYGKIFGKVYVLQGIFYPYNNQSRYRYV